MFNLQGSELIIILLLALVVLGPEKLPDAMRRAGKAYADLKKMASGFQDEFKAAIDEPVREMQETVDMLRDSADFTQLAEGERSEKPKSAEMGAVADVASADSSVIPVDELPSAPSAAPDVPTGSDGFDDLSFGPAPVEGVASGSDAVDSSPSAASVGEGGPSGSDVVDTPPSDPRSGPDASSGSDAVDAAPSPEASDPSAQNAPDTRLDRRD